MTTPLAARLAEVLPLKERIARADIRADGFPCRKGRLVDRFESFVERVPFHSCWEWSGICAAGVFVDPLAG